MLSRRESFPVHTFDVDAFGTLVVPALSGYLSEIAGQHAAELGVGLERLLERGLTWVLARQRIEMPVPVRLRDTIEVETWPSGVDRLAALREFVVRRGDEEVARASTQWFVLDVATRRPVRPAEVLDARFPRERLAPAAPFTPGKLASLAGWELQKRFHVRYGDIDVNLHVTNTSYVTWALEAVPREVWQSSRPSAVEVQFVGEAHHGSAILSRVARSGERELAHAIVREEDEKELARLVTRWTPRG
jgi:medium-chain acyl-[acyl-carrier-protein] hydrolase